MTLEEENSLFDAALVAIRVAEDQLQRNFALELLATRVGIPNVDASVLELLSREDVQREVQKHLFPVRVIRQDVERLLSKRRGEPQPPSPRAN